MADERDPKLSQHYRELEPLEPPPALDQKILAAAREATESGHAPLVAPTGRHRWYYSLAAAAVLVFAVALTLHLDRERPDPEAIPSAAVRGEIKQPPKVESAPRAEPQRQPAFAPDPRPSVRRDAAPAAQPAPLDQAERLRAERSAASSDASRAQAEARAAREAAMNAQQAANAEKLAAAAKQQAASARLAAPAAAPPENPDRWLERIAELRSRGRHADADRELAAFRKAYPNYPLSNVMRERVEGTPTPSQ